MRKYEIDYLRVYAFLLLILFHAGMLFVPWDFYIKNNETSKWFDLPMFFTHQWRLPLLFIISGIGTYFSISRRSLKGFAGERFIRLFIPLVFGIIVIVPPQVYIERLIQGFSYSSYWDFYIHDQFTKGYYGNGSGGNIGWHHLWFIMYLFIFSMLLIVLKKPLDAFSTYFKKMSQLLNGWIIFFFLCIPTFLSEYYLRPLFPMNLSLQSDWYIFSEYLWFFLCGYLISKNMDDIWPVLKKSKYATLLIGISCYLVYGYLFLLPGYEFEKALLRSIHVWFMLFSIFGFAIQYLTKKSSWLAYANEAVYPFYILHQTVMAVIIYYIRDLELNIFIKFGIVASGTFLICWILYHFLIRKIGILRFLFGMKPRPKMEIQKNQAIN